MATRKNQHFVPRSLLKPWTLGEQGRAINVYNIRGDQGVKNAPVKGQCSRDYFYGADLRLETWLGEHEGLFASTVRPMPSASGTDNAAALSIIREFCFLQELRTERSIAEQASALRDLYDAIYHGAIPEHDAFPTHEEIVRNAINAWRESHPWLEDLKGVFVHNLTSIPFVISDDPAVQTNRLHLQRLNRRSFGVGSSGIIFVMPLTPVLAAVFYDGHVYTMPGKANLVVPLKKERDAHALNELQFIKANENIYFGDWKDFERIRAEFRAVSERRIAVQHRLTILVPVDGQPGRFRRPPEGEDLGGPGETMIHTERITFNPTSWPSVLRYRSDAFGYSDGSAAGYVRKSTVDRDAVKKAKKIRF